MPDTSDAALARLIAKDEIRELVLLYSRGVDRKDIDLLRTLYTEDATDHHGTNYAGHVDGYLEFLAASFPYMHYSGHHICNHLISIDGDTAEGEVYGLAYHLIPNREGGFTEDFMAVRYMDKYRRDDGRWRFAARVVTYDYRVQRPAAAPDAPMPDPLADPSVAWLTHRLFARGERA